MFDYERLKEFLLTLKADDFRNGTKIKHCTTRFEIERYKDFFGKDKELKEDIPIIEYGGYFIVDVLGSDLSIVKLTRRGYKTPKGRLVHCKIVSTIIDDCHKYFGTALNGYWEIPKEFYNTK